MKSIAEYEMLVFANGMAGIAYPGSPALAWCASPGVIPALFISPGTSARDTLALDT